MDAPYDGIVATEEIRLIGPTETQLEEYNEEKLIMSLNMIFDYIITNFKQTLIIIQIARGKSSFNTIYLLRNILKNISKNQIEYVIQCGYKSENYFHIPAKKFVFVNIGMVARLTYIYDFPAGTVLNPITSVDLDLAFDEMVITNIRSHSDNLNILNNFTIIQKIILFGISDNMPFITPNDYIKEKMQILIDNVDLSLFSKL